ncbi:2-amino-4-hydroxy-6-hydroxymethyldihydropteridine diphosphokinase [Desulfonema magnum]|uniref:2-amino-4-hydroxy-6- hydroxymethyldihydropteridine diphosphokinase n=1 Tax=Desulfonema magnum TaxID=45655 RepID=UPI0023EF2E24|nr:2-amino-4-hydroxy-6-hydroxymethyldihydropteridine diphosphokinase [Desulfonema magnum]
MGSNIGDKLLNCQNGIAALTTSGKSVLHAQSQFYKTEPVDYKDQDWFINAVVKIGTSSDPFQLLNELKSIEGEAGRTKTIRFGPRILDLDILLYDDVVIDNISGLSVPHARMHQRRFVLRPMCDIAPELVHPVLKKDMQYLLNHLDDNEQKIIQFK